MLITKESVLNCERQIITSVVFLPSNCLQVLLMNNPLNIILDDFDI